MRLIDADDLIKYIPTEEHGAIVAVKCCPTTYDVNKVVEEMKESATYDTYWDDGGYSIDIDEAINIVKRGGVDD